MGKKKWILIERVDYWDFNVSGDETKRYERYKAYLQKEADVRIEGMCERIGGFFTIPIAYVQRAIPKVYVTDTVAGGGAQHLPGSNSIRLPNKYALLFFFGQATDLRQTNFYPTLAHEVAHAMLLAALTQGDTNRFVMTYLRLGRIEDEFFARLSQRLICEDMQIVLTNAVESDFRNDDPHLAFVFADKHFEEIKRLHPGKRSEFSQNPETLLKYMN